ncbi:unnamed protein product [Rotaria magnacalcarata]|uniref:AH domain-containing protein n=1 Tax=Rotaria magnacalcarata TaxID=392030 RepID=A0A819L7M2_9BILA|nr:unnamed protein product [Rotaria magnacalcarata]CAF2228012.1 unnamed protein product [Rotaria magnacalcarata]CAF3916603.1 unnamed protein product [Rotaria magnacalcarata]CAF3956344.1 unnamed protein product [Rotaria magnacalcarata]
MSSLISNVDSSSTTCPILNANNNSTSDSASAPSSYVSLLESCKTPDGPALSFPQRTTLNWSKTLNTFRHWSSRTLKYTRQLFQERIGHVVPTQDIELEQKIQLLRETKRHYEHILNEARQMSICFAGLLQIQRSLGESFSALQRISESSDDLVDQLVRNSQCQKVLALNGDTLLHAINTFVDKLQTLTNKTIEDTLITIKTYENARIEYDAYRFDYEVSLTRNKSGEQISPADEYIQQQYQHFKQRYEKTKEDVAIKLKLLDENRILLMKQQLLLFHNAIGAYFSINRQQLNL